MRDDYRIKDKYELSLDNRQIVTSFVAAIVVIGTVFVLGVVVGKKLASAPAHASAPDLLTALDQRAAAMEQVKTSPPPEARLTFQEELTKKVADSPPKEVPPPPESPAEPAKVASPEKPPSSAAAQTLVEELPREKLKKAIASVERPPREVSNPPVAFTLQLSASQTREDADRFAAKLRAQGYQPYIVESDLKDRGRWYRVRMGKFFSKEAAAKFRDDFHRETKLDAFVTLAN
ncbi:MAG TPA: SPOR domain-containing protein [Myxococcaceae bacterium]|nr:SPOR domain-containing protein [Myxococcaceae bacterium]